MEQDVDMRRWIVGFVGGVAYVQTWAALPGFFMCLGLPVLACLLVYLCRSRQAGTYVGSDWARTLLLVGTGGALGIVWAVMLATIALSDTLDTALEGQDVTVIGIIDSLPDVYDTGTHFTLKVERVVKARCCVRHFPGRLSLGWYARPVAATQPTTSTSTKTAISHTPGKTKAPAANIVVPRLMPGERWQLTVQLKRVHGAANPLGFDAELRALEQGIRASGYVRGDTSRLTGNQRLATFVATPGNLVARMRYRLRDRIEQALRGQPYTGVITALVVGDQKTITPANWEVFRRTGVSHLVAISGLHITLVAGTLASLFAALWRRSFYTRAQLPLYLPVPKARIVAGVVAAWGYVLLAGFGVPAQRALYMLVVIGCTRWLARLTPLSTVLMLALLVVVMVDPWAILSAGFWLSFGAVGILLFTSAGRDRPGKARRAHQRQQHWLARRLWEVWGKTREGARSQYVMTLGLLPLTLLLFGQYSLASPLANAVAIPAVTLLVAPLSLVGSCLPAPLSVAVLSLAHGIVSWLVVALEWMGGWSLAMWTTPLPPWWMFMVALAGTLLVLAPKGWPLRWIGGVAWVPILCHTASAPPDNTVWLTAFDVGQGMALLVETRQHRLLYDTGPSQSGGMDTGKRILLPYLAARGIDTLDMLLVSHSDDDHIGGALSVMQGVAVSQVLSSIDHTHPVAQAARSFRQCARGQHWTWDGVEMTVLHPLPGSYGDPGIKPNSRSCVLRISVGQRTILLAGDIEAKDEHALLGREYHKDLHADILLAPHHGSGTSSSGAFLHAVHPSIALFQMGYLNRFRHPKPVVWSRYGALGIKRFRSDRDGAVQIEIDGEGVITSSAYRQAHARYWHTR